MTFSAGQGLHELLVPVRCAGCGAPGVDWCEKCHKHLAGPPCRIHPRVAIPCPVWSISPYSGPVAAGIVALKEDRRQALAQPFGQALAHAAAQLVAAGEILHPAERPWLLVPAPSTALSIRERGFHHVREIAEAMAHTLQGAQYDQLSQGIQSVQPVQWKHPSGQCDGQTASLDALLGGISGEIVVADVLQAAPHTDAVGLTATQRRDNLAGTITCHTQVVEQLEHLAETITSPQMTSAPTISSSSGIPQKRVSRWEILLVDDVTTTGATIAECFFALHNCGLRLRGALTLCAA